MRGALLLPQLLERTPTGAISPLGTALSLRGGEASAAVDHVLDAVTTGRMKTRLESYGSLAVIAALLMNAALRMWSSAPADHDFSGKPWVRRLLRNVFLVASAISIIGGLYSTVIFALVGVYAKSAMGLGLDQQCAIFLKVTHIYRREAYNSFVAALVSFVLSFELAIVAKLKDEAAAVKGAVVGASSLASGFLCERCFRVLQHAYQLVYKPRMSAGL